LKREKVDDRVPSKEEEMWNDSKFFTIARFEPDSWTIYALFVVMVIALYALGFRYLAILPAATLAIILVTESLENIQLEKPSQKRLIGARCRVVRPISKAERGVVEIIDSSGNKEWELWSAESADSPLEVGSMAKVTQVSGLIINVEPLEKRNNDEDALNAISLKKEPLPSIRL
jgi:membrane protein implicated in regulation of membrane protease activity